MRRGEIWKLCNYTLPNSAVQYCEIYYSRTRFGCLDNDKKKKYLRVFDDVAKTDRVW